MGIFLASQQKGKNTRGDRCTLTLTIRKADRVKWEEQLRQSRDLAPGETLWSYFDEIEEEAKSPLLDCTLYKARDGLDEDRLRWATAGLEFHGRHGAGGSYPAALFVAIDGELHDVPALDGEPVVVVDAYGNAKEEGLSRVRCYLRAHAKLRAHWYGTNTGKDPARVACELLVAAYQAGATGESIDWSDLDAAYVAACVAVGAEP